MLLQLHNLSVHYGAIRALHDVSLHIDRGEIVTLIGSNGAGKTALLRTISGLLKPTAGSIDWDDAKRIPLTGLRPDEIVRLGISHSPELNRFGAVRAGVNGATNYTLSPLSASCS